MSSFHTTAAWFAPCSDHDKVGLLALAECIGSEDMHHRVTLNFAGLNAIQRLTHWSTTEVEEFARRALRLPDDYPLGGLSGITFEFGDAVDAVVGVARRDQETGLSL